MAKNKRAGRPTPSRRLVEGMYQAYELLDRGKAPEALLILEELDRAYPNTAEVVGSLVNAYAELQDVHKYEHALRRLARLEPRDPDIAYPLAAAYMGNARPALALIAFREALRRWPGHPLAEDAQREVHLLEDVLRESLAQLSMSEEQALDLMAQHDEVRFGLDHGEYRAARQAAEKLLRHYPDFVPVLNNLVELYTVDGEIDRGMQTSQRVLEIEPNNIHALSNLTRLHFLQGHLDEARQYAQRLKDSPADAFDRWTKIAEALTYLEDDAGILALYDRVKAAKELEPPHTSELFYHFLAAAAYFQGKVKDAEKYWRKALKINPHFEWAQQNLEDLKKPDDERSGAWALPFQNWLMAPMVKDLGIQLEKVNRVSNTEEAQKRLARFLEEKYPQTLFVLPYLLRRGDAGARDFIVRIAAVTGHPEVVAAAKEIIFGRRGSFQERFQLANILSETGLLPSGPLLLWSGKEQRQALLLKIEIDPEMRPSRMNRRAQALAEEAHDALNARHGRRAQELLEEALAITPDEPSLINNLIIALNMQGHSEESERMIKELHTRYPNYFFGIVSMAGLEAKQGNLERAHEMLNGLMEREKMHPSEFAALCQAQIQIWLAEKNREAARSWLDMWERVDPEHPGLRMYRMRVG